MLQKEKGITLVELLAALAICSFLVVSITYVVHYTNSSATHIGAREEALRQSTAIIDRIVKEVEHGLLDNSSDSEYVLKLDAYRYFINTTTNLREKEMTGDYSYFAFDPATNSVSLKKSSGGQTIQQTLSSLVENLDITVDADQKRIDIELTMQLPRHQTHTVATTIYIPRLD